MKTRVTTPSVLVIDDDPAIRKFVSSALDELGSHESFSVADAETALETIERRRPDIVISDVKLPGMSGVDLARMLKSSPALSSTPVFLMSAFGEPAGHIADGFLAKPFSIDQLLDVLRPYVD